MSRINSNVTSLLVQRTLGQNNTNLTRSLERLSTGYRINRGADDPAGLVASEKLRSEIKALEAAIGNAERADQIANIVEGGLQEIGGLLVEVQGLIGQNGSKTGLTTEEKEANQLQLDQILQTIDRISSTTTFNGTQLLNGSHDFQVSAVNTHVSDHDVFGSKIATGSSVAVNVVVTGSAQRAGLFINLGGTFVDTGGGDATERLTFELAGTKGTREFSFSSGTAIEAVTAAINQFKDVTGVSALTSGNFVELKTDEFGSSQFVSFDIKNAPVSLVGSIDQPMPTNETLASGTSTAFTAITAEIRDSGQDVRGVINGITAAGRGTRLSIATDALDISLTLDADDTVAGAHAQELGSFTALNVLDGGAQFNLGPQINITNQVRLGIGNVASRNLGSNALGFLDDLGSGKTFNIVSGNLEMAQKIVNEAINDVSNLRGRIGAFQSNVVQSTIRSLGIGLENTIAAESIIRDTDFASETANLTRNQILVQASTSMLSIANANPQSVLALL